MLAVVKQVMCSEIPYNDFHIKGSIYLGAFMRNAPILILDEPTAALDSHAETEIQGAIDSLEHGRTVICIAHRLSTLANMDEIVVLDHGRAVEQGSFEKLLKAKGHFAKMAEQQRLTASS